MGAKGNVPADKVVGRVLLCIGLASLAVLALAARKVMLLDRAMNAGDVAVLGVFAIFGGFCAVLGWRLMRNASPSVATAPAQERVAPAAPRRVSVSQGCAAAGVLLLILAALVPWYPVALLFGGLALLAVSHALTPCVERREQLRRARDSMRQL